MAKSILIFILIFSISIFATTNKIRTGIIDFVPKGASQSEAQVAEEMFRNILVESGRFDVLDRNNMGKILQEQSFQKTGCTETACAVEIGKILNMQYMFYGSLMRIGTVYVVSIGMVNVETSQIVTSVQEKYKEIETTDEVIKRIVDVLISKLYFQATAIEQDREQSLKEKKAQEEQKRLTLKQKEDERIRQEEIRRQQEIKVQEEQKRLALKQKDRQEEIRRQQEIKVQEEQKRLALKQKEDELIRQKENLRSEENRRKAETNIVTMRDTVRVGVIDFTGKNGISASEASTTSDIFRSMLVKSTRFTLLERSQMDTILKEVAFQQTGCTEAGCAVQIGRMLNMERIIYGTVSRVEKKIYVNISMIDIETSKVLLVASRTVDAFGQMEQAMMSVVQEFQEKNLSVTMTIARRDEYLGGVVRSGIIAGSCLAAGITTWIIGDVMYNDGLNTYNTQYVGNPNSSVTTDLHDKLIGIGDAADTLYLISESTLVLSAAFIAWGIFDFIQYQNYDAAYKKMIKLSMQVSPAAVGCTFSYRF
ncbi:MAG: hypothetical protein HZC28_07970 [Spirochaetes bacterium]|nr:hypothetical protein [Spirochaetota bacterium]